MEYLSAMMVNFFDFHVIILALHAINGLVLLSSLLPPKI